MKHTISKQGQTRVSAAQITAGRRHRRRWASAHLPPLPCQRRFLLAETSFGVFREQVWRLARQTRRLGCRPATRNHAARRQKCPGKPCLPLSADGFHCKPPAGDIPWDFPFGARFCKKQAILCKNSSLFPSQSPAVTALPEGEPRAGTARASLAPPSGRDGRAKRGRRGQAGKAMTMPRAGKALSVPCGGSSPGGRAKKAAGQRTPAGPASFFTLFRCPGRNRNTARGS